MQYISDTDGFIKPRNEILACVSREKDDAPVAAEASVGKPN
jgi:hypothetical protein